MRRIDRLILEELIGPWLFGVAIFTVLIMAGSFLFQFTDFVVKGIPFWTVMQLTLLLLPGILAKTFPMAVLLATLLAFGRLSNDSEIVALKAAGASVVRIMRPVALFGFAVAGISFAFNETLVPASSFRATAIQREIVKTIDVTRNRSTYYPIIDEDTGRLQALLSARDFSLQERTLTGANVVVYDDEGKQSFVLLAETLRYVDERDWEIVGPATIFSADGQVLNRVENIWPRQLQRFNFSDEDVITAGLKDLDSFSMSQMREQIRMLKANPQADPGQIANLEYGYWNKIALPLAALVYALVGAPLGIRNHRTGTAAGFWISVIIIFGYLMLANFMAIYAQGGAIPAWVASFLPLAIGLGVAAFTIYRKNQ